MKPVHKNLIIVAIKHCKNNYLSKEWLINTMFELLNFNRYIYSKEQIQLEIDSSW